MKAYLLTTIATIGLLACGLNAAPMLSYSTSGGQTTITAADGGTTYWQMVVDNESSTRPGRVRSFFDLSGASSETFNYAMDYSTGPGMIDPSDNNNMRDANKWTLSDWNESPSQLTYTLSRTLTQSDTGAQAVYSMEWTISTPTIMPQGYNANINIRNSWSFDELWVGGNGQARARSIMRLTAPDGDEYTWTTHNGVASGEEPEHLQLLATMTGANPDMAAGSTIAQTLTYGLHDTAYDTASGAYDNWATDHFRGYVDLGATGNWAGNPGPAGEAREFENFIDMDITIVPEPASMALLGLSGLVMLARRR